MRNDYDWLNATSRLFLSRGYLSPGETAEERIEIIANGAENTLRYKMGGGKRAEDFFKGFAQKLITFMKRGWPSFSTPIWINFANDRGLPISCNGTYFGDSVESIAQGISEIAIMTKMGAGTSGLLSDIRWRGSPIKTGGTAFGPVHFAEWIDSTVNNISQGDARRGNFGGYISADHPDAMEWMEVREEHHPITKMSTGLTFTDKWMQDMIDGDPQKRELWLRAIRKKIEHGYPYMLWTDNADRGRPQVYKDLGLHIRTSNLCFTGDTIVAVADGRNGVRIDQLEDTEFPVYSARRKVGKKGWKTEVKKAKAFKTGTKKVVTVYLSDGTSFRCTEDHKIALADGGYITARESSGSKVARFFTAKKNNYRMINSETNGFAYQHRLIWENENGPKPEGHHIDHLVSGGGDQIENLQLLQAVDHFEKTSNEVRGENNSVHKIVDVAKWKEKQSISSTREQNGHWSGVTDEQIISAAFELEEQGKHISIQNLRSINPMIPKSFSKNRFDGDVNNVTKIIRGEIEYVEPETRAYVEETFEDSRLSIELFVDSVVDNGEVEDVYDLSVEDNHNFYILTSGDETFHESSGLLVHNCTEIMLPLDAFESFVCNLSSLNLLHYHEWKNTDLVETMTYFLDAVMEEYIQKTASIKYMERPHRFAKRHRALGLGVLGWHTFLQSNMIAFDDIEAFELNEEIFSMMNKRSLAASKTLADLFGEPEVMAGTGLRNSTRLAIAPTKSSSTILGGGLLSQGIEPIKDNYHVTRRAKVTKSFKNPQLGPVLAQYGMDNDDTWTSILKHGGSIQHLDLPKNVKNVFRTFVEIDQRVILLQAAQRQKHIDQGQSMNLTVHPSTSTLAISRLHILAWRLGCKSSYYMHGANLSQEFARDQANENKKSKAIVDFDSEECIACSA